MDSNEANFWRRGWDAWPVLIPVLPIPFIFAWWLRVPAWVNLLLIPLYLVAAIFAAVIIAIPVSCIVHRYYMTRLLARFGERAVLVWQTRRGWGDFMLNNVLPALPHGVAARWDPRQRDNLEDITIVQLWFNQTRNSKSIIPKSRPYLFFVRKGKVVLIDLHIQLMELKSHAKRDRQVQSRVSKIIADCLAEHSWVMPNTPARELR